MKFGIFGSVNDPQCRHVADIAKQLGHEVTLVEDQALNQRIDHASYGETLYYDNRELNDILCWYLRYSFSPIPETNIVDGECYLLEDWFERYMRSREKLAYMMSWLMSLQLKGIPVVNKPEHSCAVPLKGYQLSVANKVGLITPQTLITNNPERVRAFVEILEGNVVCKPLVSGGICRHVDNVILRSLDRLCTSPVIFQERIVGRSVRVTIIGDKLASAVTIPSESLDYRDNPHYRAGEQQYHEIAVPETILSKSKALLSNLGLEFSGLDFQVTAEDKWVFLEANSSPVFLDIELKTGHPISKALVNYIAGCVRQDIAASSHPLQNSAAL